MSLSRFAAIAAALLMCASPASAQGTLRIAMTASDIPTPTGMPNNGFEGMRFLGFPIFEGLVLWDLSSASKLADLRPGLAEKWEQSAEDWQWTLEVNLLGVVNGIRAFVPHLLAQGSGHVVNTSSIAGLAPVPGGGNGAYTASKHAVVGLSETLVEELATVGADVGVTVLCPGPVPSRIHTAERNRPAGLVAAAAGGGSLPPPDFQLTLEPVDAATVADLVCAAIESGRRYVLPGPGTPEMARRRIDTVLADLG